MTPTPCRDCAFHKGFSDDLVRYVHTLERRLSTTEIYLVGSALLNMGAGAYILVSAIC